MPAQPLSPPSRLPGADHPRRVPRRQLRASLTCLPPVPPPRKVKPSCEFSHNAGYLVLTIPAGKYVLTEKLLIKRSRLVLRGAGMGATVLQVPKSECAEISMPAVALQMPIVKV